MSQINIKVVNHVEKFLTFYQLAKDCDEHRVWELWKEHYNFAAVPPGEQGEKMAQELLKNAWHMYPSIIDNLIKWKPDVEKAKHYLKKVTDLLNYNQDIDIVLVYFVGAFDHNPFVAPINDGKIALCMPVEDSKEDIMLTHELTHIVHSKTAELAVEWERSLATVIIQEGLAMHVSKRLVPNYPIEDYVEHKKGWLVDCKKQAKEIIQGLLPVLEETSYEKVFQFTMGHGTTGCEREAYYVGWVLVEHMLKHEYSFEKIAAIKQKDMPDTIRQHLHHLMSN